MRKAIFLFTVIALGLAALAWGRNTANDQTRAITAVAQNYMDAYYTADPALMQRSLHPDFHKRTLRTVNGQTQITEDTVQSMVEGVGLGRGRDIPPNERVRSIHVLDVYRDAARVKVVTGRWIDYMHLSKLNDEWRVLDVVLQYTRN
jgi:Putative lumazine-binding